MLFSIPFYYLSNFNGDYSMKYFWQGGFIGGVFWLSFYYISNTPIKSMLYLFLSTLFCGIMLIIGYCRKKS